MPAKRHPKKSPKKSPPAVPGPLAARPEPVDPVDPLTVALSHPVELPAAPEPEPTRPAPVTPPPRGGPPVRGGVGGTAARGQTRRYAFRRS
ncbi:hypothetical protein V6U81_26335 [Micromonospora sp. CPCC 205711]|uniref:hypothetical protein n=1 Tax=Micromonospora sp. CPCC 205547 TaxID=3122400 RepID=UPI002FF29172